MSDLKAEARGLLKRLPDSVRWDNPALVRVISRLLERVEELEGEVEHLQGLAASREAVAMIGLEQALRCVLLVGLTDPPEFRTSEEVMRGRGQGMARCRDAIQGEIDRLREDTP